MGSTQSLFFPDNPNRLKRAQELSDDCKYCQDQYDSLKSQVEATLGQYKPKLDRLLAAFGCTSVADLDRLVLQTATGDALAHWQQVRTGYDQASVVDQVIMGAEGVVAIAGLTISAVGALAGGFGFFAGIAVTGEIELMLGLVGALYDIINGAIQRDKLRDAINQLVPTRLKAKYAQEQMNVLFNHVPTILTVYQAYEDLGYNKDKILQKFKDHEYIDKLKADDAKVTYASVGQELADMDSRRHSWTNEDPDWHSVATPLDPRIVPVTGARRDIKQAATPVGGPAHPISVPQQSQQLQQPPASDGSIAVHLTQASHHVSPMLSQPLRLRFLAFTDETSAKVLIQSLTEAFTLVETATRGVTLNPAQPTDLISAANQWTVCFVNPADASYFTSVGEPAEDKQHPSGVRIYVQANGLYLTGSGTFTADKQLPDVVFNAAYYA